MSNVPPLIKFILIPVVEYGLSTLNVVPPLIVPSPYGISFGVTKYNFVSHFPTSFVPLTTKEIIDEPEVPVYVISPVEEFIVTFSVSPEIIEKLLT